MNNATNNRIARREKKHYQKRHGQRGGSGKRSALIQDIWSKRAEDVKKKRESQQPAK